ncbi:hypothetical protein BX600DRAFT_104201 [Xylariales sp. PMI_506]|nr:hypothetical protein BX600DRAFT_104201 [Xylariales sp. PMI_506]
MDQDSPDEGTIDRPIDPWPRARLTTVTVIGVGPAGYVIGRMLCLPLPALAVQLHPRLLNGGGVGPYPIWNPRRLRKDKTCMATLGARESP